MIVALISGAAAILVAAITASGVYVRHYFKRYDRALFHAENRITALEAQGRQYWLYTRQLIDRVYSLGGTPPSPPKGLFDD